MNGWERLGFVVATAFALPTAFITYDMNRHITARVPNSAEIAQLKGQDAINKAYQMALRQNDSDIGDCRTTDIKVYGPQSKYDFDWDLTCERPHISKLGKALQFGIIPYLIIWGIGLTIAWVRAGFKRKPA